jgi:hypothetical protein
MEELETRKQEISMSTRAKNPPPLLFVLFVGRGEATTFIISYGGVKITFRSSLFTFEVPNHTIEFLDITTRSSNLTKIPLYPFLSLFSTGGGL